MGAEIRTWKYLEGGGVEVVATLISTVTNLGSEHETCKNWNYSS
jgi:hypothetical protein